MQTVGEMKPRAMDRMPAQSGRKMAIRLRVQGE